MEVLKEDLRQPIEPQFLSQALARGSQLHIGQMNKTEHHGVLRDIGRYEINIEEHGTIVTLLKKDISFITVPYPLLAAPLSQADTQKTEQPAESTPAKPNIQQEFLDKAIKENQLLTLYTINGDRIKAALEAYDSFTLLLKEGDKQHLYYKHSITTINR